jgi:hypothetical protein
VTELELFQERETVVDTKTAKMVEVMQASIAGKEIQHRRRCQEPILWMDFARYEEPSWDWLDNDYRVKPVTREWWIIPSTGKVFTKPVVEACGLEVIHVREIKEN